MAWDTASIGSPLQWVAAARGWPRKREPKAAAYVSPAATTDFSPCQGTARGSFFTSRSRLGLPLALSGWWGMGGRFFRLLAIDKACRISASTACSLQRYKSERFPQTQSSKAPRAAAGGQGGDAPCTQAKRASFTRVGGHVRSRRGCFAAASNRQKARQSRHNSQRPSAS